MRKQNTETICKRCGGAGHIPESGAMRIKREKSGKSLRETAALMEISPAYLSDLELGRRWWNADLIARYKAALGAK